ncbi:MAG TPA: hypothetical protein PK295_04100, partial [Candidatus Magasanikbacteria bacterium]|nr:hypothetical protein [Candidatus Magasanikbacteria bacterium]
KKNINDFLTTEDQLWRVAVDPIGEDVLRRSLTQMFLSASDDKIHAQWWTMYRLFSDMSWGRVRNLPSDFVVDICFGKQLVMACILKFEPIDELLWYLGLHSIDKNDAIAEYSRIRKAVFESEMVVGLYKNQPQTVKSIVQEITRLNQMNNPSLEVAEFKAKLETIFFSEIPDPEYIERLDIDKRESVATFFSFIHFLIGVKPELIFGLVEEALHADKLVIEESKSESTDIMQKAQSTTVSEAEPKTKVNYFVEIKKEIENDFIIGKIGDEVEVFDLLQSYSEQYNDPRILDLYYYDEQQEKFVWNEELLNEN